MIRIVNYLSMSTHATKLMICTSLIWILSKLDFNYAKFEETYKYKH